MHKQQKACLGYLGFCKNRLQRKYLQNICWNFLSKRDLSPNAFLIHQFLIQANTPKKELLYRSLSTWQVFHIAKIK